MTLSKQSCADLAGTGAPCVVPVLLGQASCPRGVGRRAGCLGTAELTAQVEARAERAPGGRPDLPPFSDAWFPLQGRGVEGVTLAVRS